MNQEQLKKEFIAWCEARGENPKTKEEVTKLIQQFMKERTKKALHGAKLDYIKSLKHICNEDEELVYFKKGGQLDCGCKKKGGEMKESKNDVISKFKTRKADAGTKLARIADATGSQGGFRKAKEDSEKLKKKSFEDKWKKGQVIVGKDLGKGVDPNKKSQDEHGMPDKKFNKGVHKNCGGSKLKLAKKGDKVCPKCGKIHSAGIGCTVAKFRMRGGIL